MQSSNVTNFSARLFGLMADARGAVVPSGYNVPISSLAGTPTLAVSLIMRGHFVENVTEG